MLKIVQNSIGRSALILMSIFALLGTPLCSPVSAQDWNSGIGFRIPTTGDPRVSIREEEPYLGLSLDGKRSIVLRKRIKGFERSVELDSTGRFMTYRETINDIPVRLSTFFTKDLYLQTRRNIELEDLWKKSVRRNVGDQSRYDTGRGGALRIDIPVEIKSKAFQKIFGSGTVGLDVTGEINITGGGRHENRSEVKTALNRGSDFNFKMEQKQRFKVQGHIGDKVTIGIDQDSERAFDFENNIHLKYEGYDDEIIQSIEAGNIGISLPGTKYVTFGGQSTGLFGIKMAAQIGALHITAVASQEKGEKKQMSISEGAQSKDYEIQIENYQDGYYYFLSDFYREQYLQRDDDGNFLVDPGRILTNIEVYEASPYNNDEADAIRGWAWVPEDESQLIITEGDTTAGVGREFGQFIRLPKTDYYVDRELGFIRLNTTMQGKILGVAYRDSTGRVRGQIDYDGAESNTIQLRLIKPRDPKPSTPTWELQWKNVYYLGSRNIPQDGFEMQILYIPPSGDPQETVTVNGQRMSWLQVFGLDNVNESGEPKPDNIVDNNPNIINLARGELYFPDLRPFDPLSETYQNLLAEQYRAPAIYDTLAQDVIQEQSRFVIKVKSESRSSQYNLGMNVIENSERVTLNGSPLRRNVDYTIDYFTGTLQLLKEEATLPSANVDITYESNQLFQIDKKTVMGMRAEYDLWDDSFIGATLMYLNESTLDQKIRVGKGPMRNVVWDVNTRLTAKPFFMTRFANLLPFIDTRQQSSIKFEGEIAQVIPNPNTRNNESTGDTDGVAYIDDFEAAKRITPIPVTQPSWEYSSPPVEKFSYENPDLSARGRLVFYNPFEQYPIQWIWPNRDLNANVQNRKHILVMKFTPPDSLPNPREGWGGMQMDLSQGYWNQSEAKFLEVWVKGDSGRLHFDLGRISEDVIPNGRLNTEDRMTNGIRNRVLDDGEDTGLDGMAGADPNDFWDLNDNGRQDPGEPTSYDDWSYSGEGAGAQDYDRINGTEGNANDYGGRQPDTEDMNGNGDVDLRNDYFEYSFSLDKNSPDADKYLVGGLGLSPEEDRGWRQYRIPLDEFTKKVGEPDLFSIEYVRLWVDGFSDATKENIIQIAEINLVGSEWKELGTATPMDPDKYEIPADEDPPVTVTVVNTHDNPDYIPPPGVSGERDRLTQVIAKEQSLVLKVNRLQKGYTGVIRKTFAQEQDYINYKTLKMFVYGRDDEGFDHISSDSSHVDVFLRFGADDNNYYEVRERVYEGWEPNSIEVDLIELSSVKFSTDTSVTYDAERDEYIKNMGGGRTLHVRGKPALRRIRMLMAGIHNMETAPGEFTGQIWLNELRLSDVKKEKGMAMRARMDLQWADLIRFNGEMERKDADFHNVAQRFGSGDDRRSGNFSTTVNVEKLLPSQWGISLPVSYNYGQSEATPKYLPGTDVEVTDALEDTLIRKNQTYSENRGISVSFRVNSRSQSFVVKHLLSKLRASYGRKESFSRNSTIKRNNSFRENGSVHWGVNFSRENYIKPFAWLGESSIARKLSDLKLYYTPQSINTSVVGTRRSEDKLTRTGLFSENNSFNVKRNLDAQYKVFDNLTINWSRNYSNDLRGMSQDSILTQIQEGRLGLLTGIDQSLTTKYTPKIFSFLSTNFSFTSGFKYGYNRTQTVAARDASQNRSISLNGNLNLETLVNSIYNPNRSGRRSYSNNRGRRRPPASNRGQQDESGEEDEEEKDKDTGPSLASQMLGGFFKFFTIFDPFTINYTDRTNVRAVGISAIPSWDFQFGLTDSLGVPLEQTTGGGSMNRGSSSSSQSFNTSSGFSIGRNITIALKYDQSSNTNTTTLTNGSRSKSWLMYGEDVNMMFPTWRIRVSGLEKFPVVNNLFQRISLEHSYNGQFNESFDIENGVEQITKEDRDSNFRPLIGINFQMKNGASINFRYQTTERISEVKTASGGGTKQNNQDLSIIGKWSKRSDFRLPIWPFNHMKLKNNIDFEFTFSMTSAQTLKSRQGNEFQETAKTSKWTLKPLVRYSFSNRVRGSVYYEMGKTSNKHVGDTSYKAVMMDVTIAIRGS